MKCCAHKEEIINVIVFPNKLPDSSLPVRTYKTKEKRRSVRTLHLPDRNTNFSLWIKKMIWTLLVITKQAFLMQSTKLLDWVTEAGLICRDWQTPTDHVSTLMSATASPTAAPKYTARKRFASCSFTEIDIADYPAHERDVTDRHFRWSLIS